MNQAMRWSGVCLALLLLAACGDSVEESVATGASMDAVRPEAAESEAPASAASNSAPVVDRVRLSPASPLPGETVTADADVRDADGDTLTLSYKWRVNREAVSTNGPSLHVDAAKGAMISVTVTANDGIEASEPETVSTNVGNLPPVLQGVVLEPLDEVRAGRDVAASPRATDPDGDPLSYEFTWNVNGSTVLDARGSVLSSTHFKRGDKIRLTVVATDGGAESKPLESQWIEVKNAPPKVTSTPGGIGDDGVFRYPIAAVDPDGDLNFRYRLLEGPDGMEVDVVEGSLVWAPREDQAGAHPVKLEIADFGGAKTQQSFVINVGFDESPASPDES